MKLLFKVFLLVKMDVSRKFLDIIMKPQYTPLKEICMMVRGLPYLIRIPNIDKPLNILRELANTKIRYKLDHPSPRKTRTSHQVSL